MAQPVATDIVKRVLQSEKAARITKHNQYVVQVAKHANKIEIRHAVETLFKVDVLDVTTSTMHGKWRRLSVRAGRRPDWKKAIVTVGKDQKIEVKA